MIKVLSKFGCYVLSNANKMLEKNDVIVCVRMSKNVTYTTFPVGQTYHYGTLYVNILQVKIFQHHTKSFINSTQKPTTKGFPFMGVPSRTCRNL